MPLGDYWHTHSPQCCTSRQFNHLPQRYPNHRLHHQQTCLTHQKTRSPRKLPSRHTSQPTQQMDNGPTRLQPKNRAKTYIRNSFCRDIQSPKPPTNAVPIPFNTILHLKINIATKQPVSKVSTALDKQFQPNGVFAKLDAINSSITTPVRVLLLSSLAANQTELERHILSHAGKAKARLINLINFIQEPTSYQQQHQLRQASKTPNPKDVILIKASPTTTEPVRNYLQTEYPKINPTSPRPTHHYPTCRCLQFLSSTDLLSLDN